MILTLDARAGNVWRSDNDGKTWDKVKGIPEGEAWDMIEHPFDSKRAFVLGQEQTHWSTRDSGKTWQKFKAKYPISYTQPALAFHAKKPDYILYAGRICEEEDFFGLNCEEVVGLKILFRKCGFEEWDTDL